MPWYLIPFKGKDPPKVKAAYRRELKAKTAKRGHKRRSVFRAKNRADAQAKLDAAAQRIILRGG